MELNEINEFGKLAIVIFVLSTSRLVVEFDGVARMGTSTLCLWNIISNMPYKNILLNIILQDVLF